MLHFPLLKKSSYLKEKMKNLKVEKFNELPKDINKLFNFFDEISHFQDNYKNLMTKEIKIEEEEKIFTLLNLISIRYLIFLINYFLTIKVFYQMIEINIFSLKIYSNFVFANPI